MRLPRISGHRQARDLYRETPARKAATEKRKVQRDERDRADGVALTAELRLAGWNIPDDMPIERLWRYRGQVPPPPKLVKELKQKRDAVEALGIDLAFFRNAETKSEAERLIAILVEFLETSGGLENYFFREATSGRLSRRPTADVLQVSR